MFRAQILRRSFSLFRRGPSTSSIVRSAARDGHDTIRIQRVAFKKPIFTKRRLVGIVFWTACFYASARLLDGLLEEEEDEEDQSHPGTAADQGESEEDGDKEEDEDEFEEYEEDEDEEETLFFFPTGLSRLKPQEFYKASDPEWQEFVKIAPDRKRVDKIRAQLIAIVRLHAVKQPQWKELLGKINPKAGSFWVDLYFPEGPPREFERPGWELTTDLTLRRATRQLDRHSHYLFNNILMPTAVAKSVGEDSWRRAVSLWEEAKKQMGWEPKSGPDTVQTIIFPMKPTSSTSNPSTPSRTAPSAPTPASSSSASSSEQQSAASPSSPSNNPAYEGFGISLPKPEQLPIMDMRFFRGKWLERRKRGPPQLPRGVVKVSGMIEIIGEKAKANVDVIAAYDPASDKYVWISIGPRELKYWTQKPKGGR
ncbi:hypothetical protein DM02DRAFT_579222 [Periconia macrospinosa]|uniref:Uncharacterized protein n=1 Tax=Periconia macrospinosa TaxID=97972 RepID=A0A2V1EBW3_9PLEO|nr:hypothetical protein DM02DRAFT_579222 [Periconia macrospinosa]